MFKKIDKGKLLEIGLQGKQCETKREIIRFQLFLIFGIILMFFLSYGGYVGAGTIVGSSLLAFAVPLTVGVMFVLIFLFWPGAEIDAIYENGITHRRVGLVNKLQGKHWIPWKEVEKIYYGKFDFEDERGVSEYVRIIGNGKDSRYFINSVYEKHSPNFYPLLGKMLKEKCPQAKWIKKDE